MLEDRRSRSSRKTPDLVTDELILILHEAGMLEFNDIFQRTVVVMKAKHMSLGGEEILRLRIYEKLQNLVSAGGLMKKGREYTALPKLMALKSSAGKEPDSGRGFGLRDLVINTVCQFKTHQGNQRVLLKSR